MIDITAYFKRYFLFCQPQGYILKPFVVWLWQNIDDVSDVIDIIVVGKDYKDKSLKTLKLSDCEQIKVLTAKERDKLLKENEKEKENK